MPIVRLKPHDPRRGHRLRQLIDSAHEGKRYVEGNLYAVSEEEADHLAHFMQDCTRVPPSTVVYDKARAFDVFASMEAAAAVLEEEVRGQLLQPSASRVYVPPGRDAPEAPVLAGARAEIQAVGRDGVPRTFTGPATRTVRDGDPPAEETFFDGPTTRSVADGQAARPPTAKERRDRKIAEAAARKRGP